MDFEISHWDSSSDTEFWRQWAIHSTGRLSFLAGDHEDVETWRKNLRNKLLELLEITLPEEPVEQRLVGHTGDFDAAVAAVEAVDEQLGRLAEAVMAAGGNLLITADHGNADDLGTEDDPHTAHTLNDVPIIYLDENGTDGGRSVRGGGTLADIAPTMLELMAIDKPAEMTGESLLE